jgi:hypothetical protein
MKMVKKRIIIHGHFPIEMPLNNLTNNYLQKIVGYHPSISSNEKWEMARNGLEKVLLIQFLFQLIYWH